MDVPTPAFTPPALDTLQELLPQFTFTSFLAHGGMGAVYAAYQPGLDRHVAIKILPPELSSDQSFAQGFTAEARAMAKLNHPNLISVYDFGEAGGMLYLVMELVSGGTLYEAAYGEMIEQSAAASMLANLARALSHAHENGLIHRDIKPANILMDASGKTKIGDFGLARSLGDSEESGDIFGTPGYTAPEVLSNPAAVDQRCDVYSLGVVLYELLTSQLPAEPFTPASMICRCDRQLDHIVTRAIHPSPDMRYTSAAELAGDLEKLSDKKLGHNTSPALATGSIASAPAAKPVKLKSAKSNGGTFLFLTLLTIAAIAYYAYREGYLTPKASEPVRETIIPKEQTIHK